MKTCSRCKIRKPRSEFSRRGDRGSLAVMSHCKVCQAEKHRKYMESEHAKEKDRQAHNTAYARDPEFRERAIERAIKGYWQDPVKSRNQKLKRNYGLTPQAFAALVEAQAGRCAICGGPPNHQGKKVFCIDHDHTTGKVRGLLCGNCNVAIGMLRESPENAFSAGNYLLKHKV